MRSQFTSLQSKDVPRCNQGVLFVEVGHAAFDPVVVELVVGERDAVNAITIHRRNYPIPCKPWRRFRYRHHVLKRERPCWRGDGVAVGKQQLLSGFEVGLLDGDAVFNDVNVEAAMPPVVGVCKAWPLLLPTSEPRLHYRVRRHRALAAVPFDPRAVDFFGGHFNLLFA